MPYVDRLIEFMQSQQGQSLEFTSGQAGVLYRADGTSVPLRQRLDLTQLQELLNEIVPADQPVSFDLSGPVCFSYAYGGTTVQLAVSHVAGNLRVRIELGGEPAAASPLQTSAAEPSIVGTVSPPAAPLAGTGVPPAAPQPAPERPAALRPPVSFPRQVPRPLRGSETRLKWLSGIIGVALGGVTSVMIYLWVSPTSMLGRMFDLRDPTAAIPVAIACMFFWGTLVCWLRGRRLRAVEPLSRKSLVTGAAQVLSAQGLDTLATELNGLDGNVRQASPLLRRLHAVVQQWAIRPSLQDADLVLQQHAATDEETVHAGYNLVRTFVWALPVLGLIGTVVGISLAVGGFAEFLKGNIEDVTVIKQSLVGVTSGLSFAFLITLEGLLTSLVLMLVSSALQTREGNLYATIQHNIAEIFLPVLQRVAPEAIATAHADERRTWLETLQRVAEGVLQTVRQGVSEWAQVWRQETTASATRLQDAAARLGTALADTSQEVIGHLTTVGTTFKEQGGVLATVLQGWVEEIKQQYGKMQTAMTEQTRLVQGMGGALTGLSDVTRTVVEGQATLQAAMQQWSDANFAATFTGFVDALATQAGEFRSATEAVGRLTTTTEHMLAAQTTLQSAMDHMQQATLAQSHTAAQHQAELLQAMTEQTQMVQGTAAAFTGLSDVTRTVVEGQATLQAAMQQWSDANFAATFTGFVDALATQAGELHEAAHAINDLTARTRDMLAAHGMLQTAMHELRETGFVQTLEDFRASLVGLKPILAAFQRPFVVQMVQTGDGDARAEP